MSLVCNHYAEGNFEVLYNGSKQYMTNFWYTNKKNVSVFFLDVS